MSALPKGLKCPICDLPLGGQRGDWPQFPFCSQRCKTIDLGRWLGEKYSAGPAAPDDRSSPSRGDEEE